MRYVEMRYVEMRYVEMRYVEMRYVEMRYVEMRYVEMRYHVISMSIHSYLSSTLLPVLSVLPCRATVDVVVMVWVLLTLVVEVIVVDVKMQTGKAPGGLGMSGH